MSDSFDVSRESSATSSLLHLLAPDDIPIIDAIVSRIPPDGTFPDAIKAYNEVMLARGLDKDNEVQYYRFMLKLSMLKGTWHDKWNTTKNGLDQHTTSAVQSSASFALSPLAKFATLRVTPLRADEYVEDDDVSLQAGTSTAVASRWNTPVPSRPTRQTASVPPPERADSKARLQSLLRQHSVPPPPPYVATAKGKERAVDQAPPAEPRVMDARTQFELEKCADAFREEVALRRAWDAWRAGFLWTKDTGQQVHRAYDQLLVHKTLQHWSLRRHQHQSRYTKATQSDQHRILKRCMILWVTKCQRKLAVVHADEFAQRQAIPLATRALNCWKAKFQTRQRLILNVAAYHSAQLAKRTIAKWTLALRTILQAEQSAASLHQMLLTRRTIKQWKEAVTKRKLRAAWRVFKKKKQLEYLRRWRELTQMSRCARVLSNLISARGALRQWIKRIVEVKDRELLVGQDIDKRIMRGAFDRWRDKCKEHKHIESLLETSLLMQQQNLARAALDVWRSLLQRRRHLAFAEQTVVGNVMVLTAWSAWEAWRERFLERRLGVLERDFEFQMRTNLRVLVFSRWLAKTSTLPAIHFRVTHLKERSWDKWRDKMTPITEVRRARQVDQRRLMVRVFEKWQAVYKKKLSSKIAARSSSQAPSSSRRPSFSGSALFTPAPRQTGMHLSRSPAPPFIHPPITPSLPLKRAAAAAPPSTTSEDSLDDERPRRPRSLVSAASSRGVARGRAAATLFSRPLSANGFRTGGGASTPSARTTVASDTPGPDGLWKHLRGGLMARGVGSSWADSRHTSPSA
ncbi:Sfi1 spindle body protein-domain-containing protein [Auriculariales sp. MPI-PUGE-AT-0066]|nr:Sfi1 spindle body protein-domain-containing protein [Auriculariales sp. MPI-PUGE-AT-0066]